MLRHPLAALAVLVAAALPAFGQSVRYVDAGRGSVPVYLPAGYDDNRPIPLIVMLHGYTSSGQAQESYLRFRPHLDTFGFMLATPDGTRDAFGNRFWNATDACCNFFGSGVDDSGYLLALIDAIKSELAVDDRLVCLMGHSNGGFMAYRMACDHPETIAAIASLAGATFNDPDDCNAAAPVHTLQIHGTNDSVILYDGGLIGTNRYPGAFGSVERWAANGGCELVPDHDHPPLDLDAGISGAETLVTTYDTDCRPGGGSELWTIVGGAHSPNFNSNFAPAVINWLLSRPKPCPADFNGDGHTDTQDVLAFLNAWSAGEPEADFNGDGRIDTQDVLAFLNAWSAGC